jgi:hypothetical protein
MSVPGLLHRTRNEYRPVDACTAPEALLAVILGVEALRR